MATTRSAAVVGTDIILQAKFLAPVTLEPYDPASITSVQILDVNGTSVLQTITGTAIVRVQKGIYEVVGRAANYDTPGVYFDKWTAVLETGQTASAYTQQTTVLNVAPATSYCTVQDLRDEGYAVQAYSDDRVARAATLATNYIDKMTGQWFSPRYFSEAKPFILDGDGTHVLVFPIPIIEVQKVLVTSGIDGVTLYEADPTNYRVYNRHLNGQTHGLDDDRDYPRIELLYTTSRRQRLYDDLTGKWPEGSGNVHIVGYFGYTAYDSAYVRGKTPDEIRHVCKLLTVRELPQLAKTHQRDTNRYRHRIISQGTKDQRFSLGENFARGTFTGDTEIDTILTMYRRPAYVGSA